MKARLLSTKSLIRLGVFAGILMASGCRHEENIPAPAPEAPSISSVEILGSPAIDSTLRTIYNYTGHAPSMHYVWYRADDAAGTREISIPGMHEDRYTLTVADESKFIRVGITMHSITGQALAPEVRSEYVGSIPEASEHVVFLYHGQRVDYGVIVSPMTGRKWLDRNLGAHRVATAMDDYQAYGDLFQWGRGDDGHQLIDWHDINAGAPVNETTPEQSSTDAPGHPLFIVNTDPHAPLDWRNPQSNQLWNPPGYINNPCPAGWHIPTRDEWHTENIDTQVQAFEQLKLTMPGQRKLTNGALTANGAAKRFGSYWSSTISEMDGSLVNAYDFQPSDVESDTLNPFARRSTGASCRCIHD